MSTKNYEHFETLKQYHGHLDFNYWHPVLLTAYSSLVCRLKNIDCSQVTGTQLRISLIGRKHNTRGYNIEFAMGERNVK